MELKEGMYVRTEEGEISKIKWITLQRWKGLENTIEASFILENNETLEYPRDNFKASNDIIDLIEVGDYVNSYKILFFDKDLGGKLNIKCINNDEERICFYEEDIKDIVTKEQFESCKYVIERGE